jgi:hypothetical protein
VHLQQAAETHAVDLGPGARLLAVQMETHLRCAEVELGPS